MSYLFPMMFLIIIITVYTGVNWWIYHSLLQAMSQWPCWVKNGFSTLYWCLALAFIFLEMFHKKLPLNVAHVFYLVSTGWLAVFLYLALSLAFIALVRWVGISVPYAWPVCFVLVTILLIIGNVRFNRPVTKHMHIHLYAKSGHADTMRVVAVSDLHLGYGINKKRLDSYVRLINNEHPDLILIGGDLIDMSVRPLWGEKMQEELNRLEAPLGVYMIPGNHEYISGINEACHFIRTTGIKLLRDSIVNLPNGILLVGRDDRSNERRKTISQLLERTEGKTPVFVLDHQPANEEVEQMVNRNVDFAFFGHTHQGQIWPLNWITAWIYNQSHGYRQRNHTHLYVSSGLGLWGPPFRIGTDSELTVFDFTF